MPPGVGLGHHTDNVTTVLEAWRHALNAADTEWSSDKFHGLSEGRVNLSQSSTGSGGTNPVIKTNISLFLVKYKIFNYCVPGMYLEI